MIILAMRFAWGLRTALPIAVGMGHIPWQRFLVLNLLSALLWTSLVAGAGTSSARCSPAISRGCIALNTGACWRS
jgi:membrane protein DedA with SNARE-associated domain